jgi:hypothetical protein
MAAYTDWRKDYTVSYEGGGGAGKESNTNMKNIRLIQIEWNNYNGLVIGILGFNNRHLLSINSAWKEFLIVEILFIQFTIYDTTQ